MTDVKQFLQALRTADAHNLGLELGNEEVSELRLILSGIASLELQLSEARARLAWIPVGERLPEVGEAVLIAYRIGRKWYIARARMNKEGQFRFTKNTKPVTHWMPLPEPPEADSESLCI